MNRTDQCSPLRCPRPPSSKLRRPTLAQKLQFLRDRRSYPDRPARVSTIETHFAWLFLTPRYAYKLKKPLRHAGMDYRALAARARACREELRLNRRLARSVYKSIEVLSTNRAGALQFGVGVRVEDYLIKMRRLPGRSMLDQALQRRNLSGRDWQRLIERLNRFFRHAEPHATTADAYLRRLRSDVGANRTVLNRLGTRIRQALANRVIQAQRRFIARAGLELASRGAYVVEGHGDLRAEHVCLEPPFYVIDCLEFDRRLRLRDPAEEMANLALEVTRLAGARAGLDLLGRFRRSRREPISEAVLLFYMSLGAATRAKLAAWHVGDAQFPDPRPWLRRTNSLLRAALHYALEALRALDRGTRPGREASARAIAPAARRAAGARVPRRRAARSAGRAAWRPSRPPAPAHPFRHYR
jgi:uncharacterized protein